MKQTYDVIVIGSGPAAVAALAGLPEGEAIAVVTGVENETSINDIKGVHSKIRAVAHERVEPVGIGRPLRFSDYKRSMLTDTATIGGLANYWGQQFVRYAEGDPWSKEIFSNYSDYVACCSAIESRFSCSPSSDANSELFHGVYEATTAKLLVGTKEQPDAGLFAMRRALELLVAKHKATLIGGRVNIMELMKTDVQLHLTNRRVLKAKRVVLAAGVVGSLRLTMASFPELKTVRLSDHSPLMTYLLRKPGRLELSRSDNLKHFNTLTLERLEAQRVKLFASFYRMSQAPIGLTLASLGLPPYLPATYPPRLLDLVTPVQVWTERSRMRYVINREARHAIALGQPNHDDDDDLIQFNDWLAGLGVILKVSKTPPGFGFHYYGGEVSTDGFSFRGLSDFLEERFSGQVVSVDSSTLLDIGVRPPTLTAMATAYKRVQNLI